MEIAVALPYKAVVRIKQDDADETLNIMLDKK